MASWLQSLCLLHFGICALQRKEVHDEATDEAFSFLLITELVGTGLQVGTGRATLKTGKEAKDSHEGAIPILHGIHTFTLSLSRSPGLMQ